MPGLRKQAIADVISGALLRSGLSIESADFVGSGGDLPWVCNAHGSGISRKFCMYFWTVGHGGKARAASEYRVQTKLRDTVPLRFGVGTTFLLGYYDERSDRSGKGEGVSPPSGMQVFVAWDPVKHLRPGASSSCQVPFSTMMEGYVSGLSVHARKLSDQSTEVVLALRPEYLAGYLLLATRGHDSVSVEAMKAEMANLAR